MPYDLEVTDALRAQGWKVKIRDNERVEPPHASIIRKTRTWRYGLRDLRFLDKEPPPREVPESLLEEIKENIGLLRAEWDRMYPENKVGGNDA